MNQLFGINHKVQGPRWYDLSQAWINTKGWIPLHRKSSQGPLKNDMNNHRCWMHSLWRRRSTVTCCKRSDIMAHCASLLPHFTAASIATWMLQWQISLGANPRGIVPRYQAPVYRCCWTIAHQHWPMFTLWCKTRVFIFNVVLSNLQVLLLVQL